MARTEQAPRRMVVPEAAGRSLWRAAAWTGVGTAVVCALLAVIAIAICWLPVSGDTGGNHANSTIRAGLLTFLAALHGGIAVDGVHASWLPLGLTLSVALTLWRAGSALADAADQLDEHDPGRLVRAMLAMGGAFTATSLVAVPFATLGTSHASYLAVALSAPVLFAVSGAAAFVRASPLREWCADRAPVHLAPIARVAGGVLCVYLSAGALLVATALVLHHDRVASLSHQLGTGWASVPVLLLGMLAAPNAVVAGTAYLAGPGFALGSATSVHVFGTAGGTLPAFPLLGAVPSGDGANPAMLTAAIATNLLAGIVSAALAARAATWRERIGHALGAAVLIGVSLGVLGWQAGGSIGTGSLRTIGPSPWQLAAVTAGVVLVVSLAGLGLLAAWRWVRSPIDEDDEVGFLLTSRRLAAVDDEDDDEDDEAAPLAG